MHKCIHCSIICNCKISEITQTSITGNRWTKWQPILTKKEEDLCGLQDMLLSRKKAEHKITLSFVYQRRRNRNTYVYLCFVCVCVGGWVKKVGLELISLPIFLYFVCGSPPQHGLMSSVVGPHSGSKPANPGSPKWRTRT